MTNKKSTKRALLASVLSLLLCVTMLLGTTFAWFTDNASVAVSTVQAGKLDVALEVFENGEWVSAEGKTLEFVKAEGAEDEAVLWEPGCTYSLPALRVVNNGDLALKYAIRITGINGDAKLNEAIEWTFGNVEEGKLLAGEFTKDIVITGHMKETAGNEYQGLTIDGIAVTVFASQLAHESDGSGNDYDANAPFTSFWDGVSVTEPADLEKDEVHITSAAEFAWLMANTQNTNSPYSGKTFVLDCSIDFGGRTITGVGSDQCNISFTFDGNGRTISNFKIDNSREWYTGLFNQVSHGGVIKNLNVENATVTGNKMVGVVVSNVEKDCTVENCTVKNSTAIAKIKKAGAVVGYALEATVKDCEAVDCDVYCADIDTKESGEIVGYVNTGCTVTGNTKTRVNVTRGVSAVSNAAELKNVLNNYSNGKTAYVLLMNDIDMNGWTALDGGTNHADVVIEGNGYTLKNMSAPLFDNFPAKNFTVKNVNFDNADINTTGSHYAGVLIGVANSSGGGTIVIDNCHITNSSIKAYKYAGGFIGFVAQPVDGAVGSLTITNSSVKDTTINTEDSSCGGFVGHDWMTNTEIKNCEILGNTNIGCDENRNGEGAKAGWFVGTVNAGKTVIDNCENNSTGTLKNVNSAAALANGFIGRCYGTYEVK